MLEGKCKIQQRDSKIVTTEDKESINKFRLLPGVFCKEFKASSKNSLCKVTVTCSPGSTIPPGKAHSFESLRCIAQNCNMGL